ncbi:glutamate decarboxylase [Dehalobacter sp. DCM]|uniref:glutamate decarboxylase n=1 Tax=Dehalobacter sp. DCM TaxID=2907827 RepID=UPI003081A37D|nr:glutamate decarboxylase [Dehalobacter sp. DCM]
MWTVIYIAPNKAVAEKYQNALSAEGILVQLRTIGSQDSADASIEILVPESEAEEANDVLTSIRIS